MRAPRMDHYGVEVGSENELDEILERARRYQHKDARVEIIDKHVARYTTSGDFDYDVINCYIGYVLPLMVEVQHFRRAAKS